MQKKSQDCIIWTFLSKALTGRFFENHLSSIFICRFLLHPTSRPSIFLLWNLLASSVYQSQAQDSSQLARLPLRCLQGLSTVLSELTYWWRPSVSGLVYTPYKSSPPENARDVLWFHMFPWESVCSDGKMPAPWRPLHETRFKQASQVGFAVGTQSQLFGFELDLPPCGNWRQWKPPVLTNNCNNVCSQVTAASFFWRWDLGSVLAGGKILSREATLPFLWLSDRGDNELLSNFPSQDERRKRFHQPEKELVSRKETTNLSVPLVGQTKA